VGLSVSTQSAWPPRGSARTNAPLEALTYGYAQLYIHCLSRRGRPATRPGHPAHLTNRFGRIVEMHEHSFGAASRSFARAEPVHGRVSVGADSTVVRVHQHAARARHEPPPHLVVKDASDPDCHTGGWIERQQIGREHRPEAPGGHAAV
jgi:hypothetical protein